MKLYKPNMKLYNNHILLRLPYNTTKESSNVISKVYRDIGSITKCKNVYDFGRYRKKLIMEYDVIIRELKRQII